MTLSKEKTRAVLEKIGEMYPDAQRELSARSPFQILVAVILSAQATDVSVNKVTPELFKRFPDPKTLANAAIPEIESVIRTIGLYHNKAKNLKACAQKLVMEFGSVVPKTREELMSLPGVGRKTANVVMGDAFGEPAIAVDTHLDRVTKRLGIAKESDSVRQVEQALMDKLPEKDWVKDHHRLIFFGRYFCTARNPHCAECPFLDFCLYGYKYLEEQSLKKKKK